MDDDSNDSNDDDIHMNLAEVNLVPSIVSARKLMKSLQFNFCVSFALGFVWRLLYANIDPPIRLGMDFTAGLAIFLAKSAA